MADDEIIRDEQTGLSIRLIRQWSPEPRETWFERDLLLLMLLERMQREERDRWLRRALAEVHG